MNEIEDIWKGLSIPFVNFHPSLVTTIKFLIHHIKAFIKENEESDISLWELFPYCYPSISKHYQQIKAHVSSSSTAIYEAYGRL